jgi:hypothetical protein
MREHCRSLLLDQLAAHSSCAIPVNHVFDNMLSKDLVGATVSGKRNTKRFLLHFKPEGRRSVSQKDRLRSAHKHSRLISTRSDAQHRVTDTLPVRRAPGCNVCGYNEEVVFRIGWRDRIAKQSLCSTNLVVFVCLLPKLLLS